MEQATATLDRSQMTRKQLLRLFKKKSRFQEIVQAYCRNRLAVIGLIIFLIIVGLAVFAPLYLDYQALCLEINPADRLLPFGSPGHIFGTDEMGRDVCARPVSYTHLTLPTN